MREFIREYGRLVIAAVGGLIVLGVLFGSKMFYRSIKEPMDTYAPNSMTENYGYADFISNDLSVKFNKIYEIGASIKENGEGWITIYNKDKEKVTTADVSIITVKYISEEDMTTTTIDKIGDSYILDKKGEYLINAKITANNIVFKKTFRIKAIPENK